jgi:hypothetical protein
MTKVERVLRLHQASDLVGEVLATLDDTQATCECCGLTKYQNWTEHNAKIMLTAVREKLARVSRELANHGR